MELPLLLPPKPVEERRGASRTACGPLLRDAAPVRSLPCRRFTHYLQVASRTIETDVQRKRIAAYVRGLGFAYEIYGKQGCG